MEHDYFLARSREELNASVGAACSEARFIHLDLAKRYGLMAAEAANHARMARPPSGNRPLLGLAA